MIGRSRTINAKELPSNASCRSGSSNASAMARRSRSSSVSSFRVCAMTRLSDSILTCHLPGHAGLFDYADEDILEREARLTGRQHAYACGVELGGDETGRLVHRLRGDDVHAVAEERASPPVHEGFEPVGRVLWRRYLQLDQVTRLLAFDASR